MLQSQISPRSINNFSLCLAAAIISLYYCASLAVAADVRPRLSPAKKNGNFQSDFWRISDAGWRRRNFDFGCTPPRELFGTENSFLQIRGGSEETIEAEKEQVEKTEKKDEEKEVFVKADGQPTDDKEEGEEDEDKQDEDAESEESEDEYDDEDDPVVEEEETQDVEVHAEENSVMYDEPFMQSPMLQVYATLGVIMLSKRLDLFNPAVVRMARFAYIVYLILVQAFVFYVRIRAKAENNRTPVKMSNPLTSLVQSQLLDNQDGGNAMVKNLASSFLSSESTVLEYDIKQAKAMQSGMLFSMSFMWFIHFKLKQMQPLVISVVTGIMQLVYSPLFQVYILGRNLERPFKNPAAARFEETALAAEESSVGTETSETTTNEESGDADDTSTVLEESSKEQVVEDNVDEDSDGEEDDSNDSDEESEED